MASQDSSGPYHHVFVTTKGAEQKLALFVDLSASELKTRFVRPYRRGREVLLNGRIFAMKDISWVAIRVCDERAEANLSRLQSDDRLHTDELNQGGGLVFMERFDWTYADLVNEGEDITARYVNAPPGDVGLSQRFGYWIAENAGKALLTVIVGAVAAWIGLKKG
ncbi:hypothetical protein [Stenotrophomonas maltophilia]|uniref:hypothetical protein n=1 Tax=Stenotrophomonas maltophilia TaxID=40324 RepID=UPI00209AE51D|nr:hypothetical protein [Stenotrophomonas maltophilia]MCO7473052.1 hypothetical protein [Stenotrophomonas maltophilia]